MSPRPPRPAPGHVAGATEPGAPARPAHLSAGNIALVAVGGALGTGLRLLLTQLWPSAWGAPSGIMLINVLGAFALGLILELLAARGPDLGWRRRIRLGAGTGVLGGFTTYSALALDTVTLTRTHPGLGFGYGLATVVLGGLASLAGIAVARQLSRAAAVRT